METKGYGSKSLAKHDETSTGSLGAEGCRQIGIELRALLADVFAIYLKTKNFHWHISGPHFRDYHLLLDEQAGQVFAMTDIIAERARKLGQPTLHSIFEITQYQRLRDNNANTVDPYDMLAELLKDNRSLARSLLQAHELCDEHRDIATASLLETWIDEAERRSWFLAEVLKSNVGMEARVDGT
jgi:starvation-inducible DNA-binding protein